MSYLDKLRPGGMRENAFYIKTRIQTPEEQIEKMRQQQNNIYVYQWDSSKQQYVGSLVNAEEYYSD